MLLIEINNEKEANKNLVLNIYIALRFFILFEIPVFYWYIDNDMFAWDLDKKIWIVRFLLE